MLEVNVKIVKSEKRSETEMWKSLSVALIVLAAVFEVSDGKLRMLFGIQCILS